MTITIVYQIDLNSEATFSTNALLAQPFTYEGEARDGLTARTFRVGGLLSKAEWQALLNVYTLWRDARILDQDTYLSGVVGSVVTLTVTAANGVSVEDVQCWFVDPPNAEQAGAYVNTSITLVDATQALQVLLRGRQKSRESREADTPSLGTVTLGSAVITLTKPMLTRQDGPQVAFTAGGKSFITGRTVAHKVQAIEGYISEGTYNDLLSWYDSAIATVAPSVNSWFPISAPTATAEVIVSGGVKSTRYNVQITLLQIR